MIKDKITPQLREKFLEEIKKSKETGKERGFYLCIEKDGKLSDGDVCNGDECHIRSKEPALSCPGRKVQGDFHTHPYLAEARKQSNFTMSELSDEQLIPEIISSSEEGFIPTMPSHQDVLLATVLKCAKKTDGTVCIGSDLDTDKVECWTINKVGNWDCIKALKEKLFSTEKHDPPHEWIRPHFDIEMIDLKNTK